MSVRSRLAFALVIAWLALALTACREQRRAEPDSGAVAVDLTPKESETTAPAVEVTPAAATPAAAAETRPPVPSRTLGDLLSTTQPIAYRHLPGFYEQVPPELDKAVRLITLENYSSASAELQNAFAATTSGTRERARVMMWQGLMLGQKAVDYPTVGWETGTSATRILKEAIATDPEVYTASDVARTLAEMAAHGWGDGEQDPEQLRILAERNAAQTKKAEDYYYAGVLWRRESARQWAFGDTTHFDRQAFTNFTRAVAARPDRYESWNAYLPSLMPIGLHDLMSTETEKMYRFFRPLRSPLISDQGPTSLYLRTRQGYQMKDDDDLLKGLMREYPDEPYAYFQYALWAIETTSSLAMTSFEDFIKRLDEGSIKLLPREEGYRVSALYKLGFLYSNERTAKDALPLYERVRELSPHYAELHLNFGVLHARFAEEITTGPQKLAMLEKAIAAFEQQQQYDYRGKSRQKAGELKQRAEVEAEAVREALNTTGTAAAGN